MVTFRRLGKLWKLPVAPVEIAGIYNYPSNGSTVTANPLGGSLHYNICAMVNRSKQVACCPESVVHDQRNIMFFRNSGDGLEIRDVKLGVAYGFYIQRFSFFVN